MCLLKQSHETAAPKGSEHRRRHSCECVKTEGIVVENEHAAPSTNTVPNMNMLSLYVIKLYIYICIYIWTPTLVGTLLSSTRSQSMTRPSRSERIPFFQYLRGLRFTAAHRGLDNWALSKPGPTEPTVQIRCRSTLLERFVSSERFRVCCVHRQHEAQVKRMTPARNPKQNFFANKFERSCKRNP